MRRSAWTLTHAGTMNVLPPARITMPCPLNRLTGYSGACARKPFQPSLASCMSALHAQRLVGDHREQSCGVAKTLPAEQVGRQACRCCHARLACAQNGIERPSRQQRKLAAGLRRLRGRARHPARFGTSGAHACTRARTHACTHAHVTEQARPLSDPVTSHCLHPINTTSR